MLQDEINIKMLILQRFKNEVIKTLLFLVKSLTQ